MKIKLLLREILSEMGIKAMVPTDKLLSEKLGGMTIIRFNQLVNNSSKTELTLLEFDQLLHWLAAVTNQPTSEIKLVAKEETPAKEEARA